MNFRDYSKEEALLIAWEDVRVFSYALGGANGSPGEVKGITNDGEGFRFNYIEYGLSRNTFYDSNVIRIEKYMGLGNILMIKEEDSIWLDDMLQKHRNERFYPNVPLYNNWVKFYEEKMSEEKCK